MKTRNFLRRHKKSRKTKFRNTRKTYSGKQKGGKLVMYIGNRNLSNLGYREKKIFSGKDGIIIKELNKIANGQNGGLGFINGLGLKNPFIKGTNSPVIINKIPTFQDVSNTEEKKEKLKDLLQQLNTTTRTKLLKAIYTMTIKPIMNPVMNGNELNINESFNNILSNRTSEDMVVCFDFKNLNTNMSSKSFIELFDTIQKVVDEINKAKTENREPKIEGFFNKIIASQEAAKDEVIPENDNNKNGGSMVINTLSNIGSVVGFKSLNERIQDALIKIYGNENSKMATEYINYMKSQGYLSSIPPASIYFYNDCIYVHPDIINKTSNGKISGGLSVSETIFKTGLGILMLIGGVLGIIYLAIKFVVNMIFFNLSNGHITHVLPDIFGGSNGGNLQKFMENVNKLPNDVKLFILYGFDPKTYEKYVGMHEKTKTIVETLKAHVIKCEYPLSKDQFRYNMLKYYAEMED